MNISPLCLRVLALLVAACLGLGVPVASGQVLALTRTVALWQTAGATKLKAADVKKAGGVWCGKVGGAWVPGSLVSRSGKSGLFLALSKEAANYRTAAKKAKGAAKKKFQAKAAAKQAAFEARKAKCSPAVNNAAPATGQTPILPPGSYPARFSFNSTVAVLRYEGSARRLHARPRQGVVSNLDAVQNNGVIRNAVTAGMVIASAIVIGPDGDFYIVSMGVAQFEQPDGSVIPGCSIFRVRHTDNWVTCLAPSDTWPWVSPEVGKPLQVGADGSVYYLTSSSSIVLKRYRNGVTTTLTNSNIQVDGYVVLSSGDVVITGKTMSGGTPSGAQWTRVLRTNDSLQTLVNSRATYLSIFPDDNLYYGTFAGARQYITSSGVDGVWGGLSSERGEATTTDGKVYAYTETEIRQQYPTVRSVPIMPFSTITAMATAGTRVALAGTAGLAATGRIGLYDPATNSTILVGDALSEMEYYNLVYSPSRNAVIFDALRFRDNTYVIGEINLATDAVSILSTSAQKIADITGY